MQASGDNGGMSEPQQTEPCNIAAALPRLVLCRTTRAPAPIATAEVASDEPLLEDEPPLEVPLPPWVLEMMNLAPSSVSPLLIASCQQKIYV